MSSEVSDETAFHRDSSTVGGLVVLGRVSGWEALGKAVLAEAEPRSVVEPNIFRISR